MTSVDEILGKGWRYGALKAFGILMNELPHKIMESWLIKYETSGIN